MLRLEFGVHCEAPVQVRDWQTGASPVKATAMVEDGKRSGEAEGTRFVSF